MLQHPAMLMDEIKVELALKIRDVEQDRLAHKYAIGDIGPGFYSIELMKIQDRYYDRIGLPDLDLKQRIKDRENQNG